MVKTSRRLVLLMSVLASGLMAMGCGGGASSGPVQPAEVVTPTDNPADEPDMSEGP